MHTCFSCSTNWFPFSTAKGVNRIVSTEVGKYSVDRENIWVPLPDGGSIGVGARLPLLIPKKKCDRPSAGGRANRISNRDALTPQSGNTYSQGEWVCREEMLGCRDYPHWRRIRTTRLLTIRGGRGLKDELKGI
ncbi:hypothetical protein NPIL_540491 [Nephila pilipes]|uniref:Uncharacterized protein n=1 Tax=Nephila pilipes TaxID=299642 RepID=A0A8X6U6R1_NEPPI|nr:hypothetical protein NPIL_540491 [Nephila pilipes]